MFKARKYRNEDALPLRSHQRFPHLILGLTTCLFCLSALAAPPSNGQQQMFEVARSVDLAVPSAYVGPPIDIGGRSVVGPPSNLQRNPAVAFDGNNYLVVWEDKRRSEHEIWGARVASSGTVIDSTGFVICRAAAGLGEVRIAFGGSNYLVVWTDWRMGSQDIYGARVTRSGTVLDPEGIAICTVAEAQYHPAIAFDGTNYLVVWEDGRDGPDEPAVIYGARVDQDGSILDVGGRALSRGPVWQAKPSIAYDGADYLLVWMESDRTYAASGMKVRMPTSSRNLRGVRLTPSLDCLDSSPLTICHTIDVHSKPAVASGDTTFLVVWEDVRGDPTDVYGARVGRSGTLLDSEALPIHNNEEFDEYPSVSFDGSNFLVTCLHIHGPYHRLRATRVSTEGVVLDEPGIRIVGPDKSPVTSAVVFGHSDHFIVWMGETRYRDKFDIYGARLSPEGEVRDSPPKLISEASPMQEKPAAAFDGTNYFVVWEEERSGDLHDIAVRGGRVTRDGTVIDLDGIDISATQTPKSDPAVAYDGANYLVVWEEYRESEKGLVGARVSTAGVVLDPERITISFDESRSPYYPSVAFNGEEYLVVWFDVGGTSRRISGVRVRPGGEVLDPNPIVISGSSYAAGSAPSVASDGDKFLVVWGTGFYGDHIVGSRVSREGLVLDPGGFMISAASEVADDPVVAFDGMNFLVVWRNAVVSKHGSVGINGARVSRTGSVIDPDGIMVSDGVSGPLNPPALAFDGTNYVVGWQDRRQGLNGGFGDVRGIRVTPSGRVLEDEESLLSEDPNVVQSPALACAGDGQSLVLYSSFMEGPPYGAYRIRGNLWTGSDSIPPALTIAVHQNPELTAELTVYLLSSEALVDTTVSVIANGTPLEVGRSGASADVYAASYRLSASGPLTIIGSGRDRSGNFARRMRVLGVGYIDPIKGGVVTDPSETVSLRCPAHSVADGMYLVILREEEPSIAGQDSLGVVFELSPPSIQLQHHAALCVRLDKLGPAIGADSSAPLRDEKARHFRTGAARALQGICAGPGSAPEYDGLDFWASLWREGVSGWDEVESTYSEDTGILSSLVKALGRYGIVWRFGGGQGVASSLYIGGSPNPFRDRMEIRYYLPSSCKAEVFIFDAAGRLVKTLHNERTGPGWHLEVWDGLHENGTTMPSAIYFGILRTEVGTASAKCILAR